MLNPSQEYAYASWVTELLTRAPPIVAIDLQEPLEPIPCWHPSFIMYTDREYSVANHHEGGSPCFNFIERQCENLEPEEEDAAPFTSDQVAEIRRQTHDSLSEAQLHQKSRLLSRIRWDTPQSYLETFVFTSSSNTEVFVHTERCHTSKQIMTCHQWPNARIGYPIFSKGKLKSWTAMHPTHRHMIDNLAIRSEPSLLRTSFRRWNSPHKSKTILSGGIL